MTEPRFGSISMGGVITWIFTRSSHHALESALKYPRPTLPPYMSPIEPQSSAEPIFAIIMTAGVVMAGILINYTIKRIRK